MARKCRQKFKRDFKIFEKHFSGATTNCRENYMKSSLQKDPNHIILHIGTNNLILDRTSQGIAISLVNLACSMKGKNCDAIISNIILRNDNRKFNQKDQEVKTHFEDMCEDNNIYLIDDTNKVKVKHLNKGKIHLNKEGSNLLSSTFVN